MAELAIEPGSQKSIKTNTILHAKSVQHIHQLPHQTIQSEKGSELISLVNFDPTTKARHFLNSPRSIQAVRNLGFEEYELLIKDKREILQEPLPEELEHDREYYVELRLEHYELRRLEKLRMCIEERSQLIQANKSSFPQSRGSSRNMNSYRNKLELITSNGFPATDHGSVMSQRVQSVRGERNGQKSIGEEGKTHTEKRKQARDMRLEELHKQLVEQEKANELRRKEQQERVRKEKENEAKRREEERKAKVELLNQKLKEINERKLEEANYRRKLMDEKTNKMNMVQTELKFKRQFESELAKQQFEEKRLLMKENNDRIFQEQRQRFLEHQREIEEKRARNEEHKRTELELRKKKSEQHWSNIKGNLDVCYEERQKKKKYYLYKFDQAEQNRRRLEQEMEARRQMKIAKTNEKEQMMRSTMREQQKARKEMNYIFLSSKNEGIRKANQRKMEQLREIQRKYFLEMLHAQDAEDNRRRLERIQNMKNQEIRERILEESGQLHRERESQILNKTKKSQISLEPGKEQMVFDRSNIGSRKSQNPLKLKLELSPEKKLIPSLRHISSSQSLRPSTQSSTIRKMPLEIQSGFVGKMIIIRTHRTPSASPQLMEMISPLVVSPKVGTVNPTESLTEEAPKMEEVEKEAEEHITVKSEHPEENAQEEEAPLEDPKVEEEVVSEHIEDLVNKMYILERQQIFARNLPNIFAALVEEEKKYNENPTEEILQESAVTMLKISKEQGSDYEKIKLKHNAYRFFEDENPEE